MRSDASAQAAPSGEQGWRQSPHTRAGRRSVTLTAIFVVLFLINAFVLMRLPAQTPETWWHVLLPFYGIAMLACGLGAAILSLLALIRQRERSWLVWLPLLPGLWVLVMMLGEFLVPH